MTLGNTTTNNNTNNNQEMKMNMSQCPYAVALSEDEASQPLENQSPIGTTKKLTSELSQCPAFAASAEGGSCPFKEAKSPEEIQQRLAQVPPSHYTGQTKFLQVLQHLHQVHEQGGDAEFSSKLPTLQGCPMKPYVADKPKGFTRAMEECSLAAIMARLAADMEEDDSENSDDVSPRNSEVSLMAKTMESVAAQEEENDNHNNLGHDDFPAEDHEPRKRNSLAEALKVGTSVSH